MIRSSQSYLHFINEETTLKKNREKVKMAGWRRGDRKVDLPFPGLFPMFSQKLNLARSTPGDRNSGWVSHLGGRDPHS